jgi:sulfotransferase family protein
VRDPALNAKHLLGHVSRTARDLAKLARLPFVPSRRCDVCCCGLSKTGTHSMAGLFENYRAAHHPDAHTRLTLAIRYLQGDVDAAVVQRTLRRRDRLLQLEMESSTLAGILIEPMVKACPEKKFILTMRDVYSWCDSWLDHNINEPPTASSLFGALDRVRLRVADFPPTKFDAPLVERGLPPLACYFQLWAEHNTRVLQAIPEGRLLIVKTEDIRDRIPDIARWAGVPPQTLRADRGWLFAAPKKHGVLATLDAAYVRETAQRFCGPLMERYFAG